MFKTENLILIGFSIILISVIIYFVYSKVNKNQINIDFLAKRCENLENLLSRAPNVEIDSIFDKQQICKDGICSFEPVISNNNEEINQIADEEINKLLKKRKMEQIPEEKE